MASARGHTSGYFTTLQINWRGLILLQAWLQVKLTFCSKVVEGLEIYWGNMKTCLWKYLLSTKIFFHFFEGGHLCARNTGSWVDSCLLVSCHCLQGSHQPDHAGSNAGVKIRRLGQLDDTGKFLCVLMAFNDYHTLSIRAGWMSEPITAVKSGLLYML